MVNRNVMFWYQPSSLCGFATRSRKEIGQQAESSYGKTQLLSDRPWQKCVSTKPVSLSERPTQIVLPFLLHLSSVPLMRRLTPTSNYNLIRATTTHYVMTGKKTEHIVVRQWKMPYDLSGEWSASRKQHRPQRSSG
jgi:hypothetical protein